MYKSNFDENILNVFAKLSAFPFIKININKWVKWIDIISMVKNPSKRT